ncbi:hypothetical protein CEXT_340971 [Caerostris extrusa]|uniref:Uncharacterized protein n=1 Tax=Caerostris extrusa TaxID=172846 RepID=A0AAV4T9T9_CAEEX|nr:hypothetical protein CEXT_340971 [Caerostris extrusa]
MNPATFTKGHQVMERGLQSLKRIHRVGLREADTNAVNRINASRQSLQKIYFPQNSLLRTNSNNRRLNHSTCKSGNVPRIFHKGAPCNEKGGLQKLGTKRINPVGPSGADTNAVNIEVDDYEGIFLSCCYESLKETSLLMAFYCSASSSRTSSLQYSSAL